MSLPFVRCKRHHFKYIFRIDIHILKKEKEKVFLKLVKDTYIYALRQNIAFEKQS